MKQTQLNQSTVELTAELSRLARQRMLSTWGEPLFVAGWKRVLMMHFEVDAAALQRHVPFPLDLRDGRAFVSLVAFTMCDMKPRIGGRLAAWLFRPIATHDFLNVRTYVRPNGARVVPTRSGYDCDDESGIHFLAEWLSNRLAVKLGPTTFGLPYHHGQIAYHHNWEAGDIHGEVVDSDGQGRLRYHAAVPAAANFQPCEAGSLTEWLMERYTAFNSAVPFRRFFRVWHSPWPQCPVSVAVEDRTLLTQRWLWFREARLIGANYSDGFDEVWMGRPHWVLTGTAKTRSR
jgi:uncharacterized protein YqjF (DUF2071 family)